MTTKKSRWRVESAGAYHQNSDDVGHYRIVCLVGKLAQWWSEENDSQGRQQEERDRLRKRLRSDEMLETCREKKLESCQKYRRPTRMEE